ncbi:hypothetical protein CDAR_6781 [Caerostris darwini]|uniref:Uncharacterized protein n=1 Tax=Caerostris darwini TaxID=1538125 RepID=A0AAV4TD48_9ARAC|nr:hypothetical protein CDAR_6781 [Caerostris darwini]
MYDMKRKTLNAYNNRTKTKYGIVCAHARQFSRTQRIDGHLSHMANGVDLGFAKSQAQNAAAPTYLFVCRSSDESRVFDLRNVSPES